MFNDYPQSMYEENRRIAPVKPGSMDEKQRPDSRPAKLGGIYDVKDEGQGVGTFFKG